MFGGINRSISAGQQITARDRVYVAKNHDIPLRFVLPRVVPKPSAAREFRRSVRSLTRTPPLTFCYTCSTHSVGDVGLVYRVSITSAS